MPVALTILLISDNSPAEDELWVMHGQVIEEAQGPVWRSAERFIPLEHDWREKTKVVNEALRDLFDDATCFLPVVVWPAPEGEKMQPLGWKLPTRTAEEEKPPHL